MTPQTLARILGGSVVSGTVSCPGPGHSKHDRSLQVFLDANAPHGIRVHSYTSDHWRECRDHVYAKLGIAPGHEPRANVRRETPAPAAARDGNNVRTALKIWNKSERPGRTLTDIYLKSRGVGIDTALAAGNVIRFHNACPFKLDDDRTARLPAMLALFRDIKTNEPCGVHRTALNSEGTGKADLPELGNPKKMLGRAKGAAIKISPDAEVSQGLAIAEGIETALTLYCAGWRPIWAMGSADAIKAFPALPGVESLTVFADNDANNVGIEFAKICRARWEAVGQECRILAAPVVGSDFNDVGRPG